MKLIKHSTDNFYYHTNHCKGSVLESVSQIKKSEGFSNGGFSKLKAIIPLASIRPVRNKRK